MAAASLPLDWRQRRRPLSPWIQGSGGVLPPPRSNAAATSPLYSRQRRWTGGRRLCGRWSGRCAGRASIGAAEPPSNVSRRCSYFRVQLRSSRCPTSPARAVHPRLRQPVPPTPSIVWPPASPRQVLQLTSCLHPPRDPNSKSLMHLVSFTPWILQNRSRSRLLSTAADVQGMDGKINSRLVGKMKYW